jgi:hypothetical protein
MEMEILGRMYTVSENMGLFIPFVRSNTICGNDGLSVPNDHVVFVSRLAGKGTGSGRRKSPILTKRYVAFGFETWMQIKTSMKCIPCCVESGREVPPFTP